MQLSQRFLPSSRLGSTLVHVRRLPSADNWFMSSAYFWLMSYMINSHWLHLFYMITGNIINTSN